MKRTDKDWKKLDFATVDFSDKSRALQWGYGRGGHPLQDDEWAIYSVDKDLNEVRYKLPACINSMLKSQYKFGGDDAINKIKSALRIS